MILNNKYKTVEIDITTYKTKQRENHHSDAMNENITERYKKCNQNRFICSICLNKKASQEDNRHKECCKRKSKSCPICQKACEIDEFNNGHKKNGHRKVEMGDEATKLDNVSKDTNGKNIQTSQPDVTKGLTLLNEVLTVFQNKKQLETKNHNTSKTVILKDASVETDRQTTKPKLTFSKTFLYSLGDNDDIQKNGKFSIINSQPEIGETVIKSQFSIDLKQKSSSIPQMKLEELKQSLKQKTKSKDAIEEVNRMFGNVRKQELGESLDDSNRPMIRSGPRVLPVVKTNNHNSESKNTKEQQDCCHCQNCYHMSSGDSIQGCCYLERYDKCCKACCHHIHRRAEVSEHCYSKNDCKHSVNVHDG
ncbi:uncharacterized protein LOC123878990 [Maniola jurtina]|uniref:uncharacterized protein LOC123878990 n=1 Tax=Maniola jurtina TaxID=191418 RepID=UPI001E686854|nr:uncharacterized protein LOC123878990 [Maniola jurtina]